jgi:predicted ATP-grasp superfamily ATP-dependent carboligase
MIGNTVSSVTVPLAEVDGARASVVRLLAETNYRGGFNVEFKFDGRDGLYKVLELNPRPAWYIATIASAGLDIPWSIYCDALDLPVEPPTVYRTGRYGLYEFLDAAAIVRDVRARRRPQGPVLGPWLRGDHTVFWWRDPMPAVRGVWQIIGRRLDRVRGGLQRQRLVAH